MGTKMMTAHAGALGALIGELLGDRHGLYRTLAMRGPMTSAALAAATGAEEGEVRDWLTAQVAAGHIACRDAAGPQAAAGARA